MADNDMGKRLDCSLFVMVKFFLFKKYSRFDFKRIGTVFNKFHRRYIIADTIESFKLFAKLDWIKYKVYKIVLPIYLWSIGYKTLKDYITAIENEYELYKEAITKQIIDNRGTEESKNDRN